MPAAIPSLGELVPVMLDAAKGSLAKDWSKASGYAKMEFPRLAQSLLDIGGLYAAGKITDVEAKSLLEIHKNTTRMVLLTVKGLGLLAVENALNAALAAAAKALQGLGWVIPI